MQRSSVRCSIRVQHSSEGCIEAQKDAALLRRMQLCSEECNIAKKGAAWLTRVQLSAVGAL